MKIIAVDDESLALKAVALAIRRARPGSVVETFQDAEAALREAKMSPPDVAFLDIEMRAMNGIELARQLQTFNPRVNIIFTTGYSEYTAQAFEMHASGYIFKPVTVEKVRRELNALRFAVPEDEPVPEPRLHIRAFGNFEAFVDGVPVQFLYGKTKELLAYLVDRNGALCSNRELSAALWEDSLPGQHASYLKSIRSDLLTTLSKLGCEDVFVRVRGGMAILPDRVVCDYYEYLHSAEQPENMPRETVYRGEYMSQYSWAEVTNSSLLHTQKKYNF